MAMQDRKTSVLNEFDTEINSTMLKRDIFSL